MTSKNRNRTVNAIHGELTLRPLHGATRCYTMLHGAVHKQCDHLAAFNSGAQTLASRVYLPPRDIAPTSAFYRAIPPNLSSGFILYDIGPRFIASQNLRAFALFMPKTVYAYTLSIYTFLYGIDILMACFGFIDFIDDLSYETGTRNILLCLQVLRS